MYRLRYRRTSIEMLVMLDSACFHFFFFFQAEDGIRDLTVTGVQTCALPISRGVAEQAAGVHPHDPTVHLLLGRIALASGRSVDAVEELRRALRLDPLAVAAHRVLGYALVGTGRFGEAVEQWDQWERLAPRSEAELAQLEEVRRAKSAAQTLAGTGTHA